MQEITLWRKGDRPRKSGSSQSTAQHNPHIPSHLVGSDDKKIETNYNNIQSPISEENSVVNNNGEQETESEIRTSTNPLDVEEKVVDVDTRPPKKMGLFEEGNEENDSNYPQTEKVKKPSDKNEPSATVDNTTNPLLSKEDNSENVDESVEEVQPLTAAEKTDNPESVKPTADS